MAKRVVTKEKGCARLMKFAGWAFRHGDDKLGRDLYHEAASRGCKVALELDGLPARRRKRKTSTSRARRQTRR